MVFNDNWLKNNSLQAVVVGYGGSAAADLWRPFRVESGSNKSSFRAVVHCSTPVFDNDVHFGFQARGFIILKSAASEPSCLDLSNDLRPTACVDVYLLCQFYSVYCSWLIVNCQILAREVYFSSSLAEDLAPFNLFPERCSKKMKWMWMCVGRVSDNFQNVPRWLFRLRGGDKLNTVCCYCGHQTKKTPQFNRQPVNLFIL